MSPNPRQKMTIGTAIFGLLFLCGLIGFAPVTVRVPVFLTTVGISCYQHRRLSQVTKPKDGGLDNTPDCLPSKEKTSAGVHAARKEYAGVESRDATQSNAPAETVSESPAQTGPDPGREQPKSSSEAPQVLKKKTKKKIRAFKSLNKETPDIPAQKSADNPEANDPAPGSSETLDPLTPDDFENAIATEAPNGTSESSSSPGEHTEVGQENKEMNASLCPDDSPLLQKQDLNIDIVMHHGSSPDTPCDDDSAFNKEASSNPEPQVPDLLNFPSEPETQCCDSNRETQTSHGTCGFETKDEDEDKTEECASPVENDNGDAIESQNIADRDLGWADDITATTQSQDQSQDMNTDHKSPIERSKLDGDMSTNTADSSSDLKVPDDDSETSGPSLSLPKHSKAQRKERMNKEEGHANWANGDGVDGQDNQEEEDKSKEVNEEKGNKAEGQAQFENQENNAEMDEKGTGQTEPPPDLTSGDSEDTEPARSTSSFQPVQTETRVASKPTSDHDNSSIDMTTTAENSNNNSAAVDHKVSDSKKALMENLRHYMPETMAILGDLRKLIRHFKKLEGTTPKPKAHRRRLGNRYKAFRQRETMHKHHRIKHKKYSLEGKTIARGGGVHIALCDNGHILKEGSMVRLNEELAMSFVAKHCPSIPVPEVLHSSYETYGRIFMTQLPGVHLDSLWPDLNDATKQQVCEDIWALIKEMRSVKRPDDHFPQQMYVSLDGGHTIDDLLGVDDDDPTPPLYTDNVLRTRIEQRFRDAHKRAAKAAKRGRYATAAKIPRLPEDTNILRLPHCEKAVLTHGDLCPHNILVDAETARITAVLDWQKAGWYPDYWELAKTLNPWNDPDWKGWMKRTCPLKEKWDLSGIMIARRFLR